EWTQRTLPEFLLISMQDPDNRKRVLAKSPWEKYEVSVAEVQVDGEVNLIGKKDQPFFQFDLDLGMRIDVEKKLPGDAKVDGKGEKAEVEYWPSIAQIVHYDNQNTRPQIITRLQELPPEVAAEVEWYLQEGMGKHFIWHGLARWHAYAVKKWLKEAPAPCEDPYQNPIPPPSFPPFLEQVRQRHLEEIRMELLRCCGDDEAGEGLLWGSTTANRLENRVCAPSGQQALPLDHDEAPAWFSPPTSEDEDDYDPDAPYEFHGDTFERCRQGTSKRKKFSRYPFLPSMLCGVGGPAKDWLRPKEYAV
ncbi:unnamed protein product, partial [Polarella glacialis]